jgi:hypothetical protein
MPRLFTYTSLKLEIFHSTNLSFYKTRYTQVYSIYRYIGLCIVVVFYLVLDLLLQLLVSIQRTWTWKNGTEIMLRTIFTAALDSQFPYA